MNLKEIKNDGRHILYNLPLSLVVIIFYLKFGFSKFGINHLITLICWSVYIYTLDDWLDGERSFPYYNLPLIAISLFLSPIITISALIGVVLINLRNITKNYSFLFEKIETIGEFLIFIPIYFVPLNSTLYFYVGALPVIFIIDQVHKLGHKETINPKLTIYITSIIALPLIIQVYLNGQDLVLFSLILLVMLIGIIPMLKAKDKRSGRLWFQIWQGYSVPLLIYFVLFVRWEQYFFFFQEKIL